MDHSKKTTLNKVKKPCRNVAEALERRVLLSVVNFSSPINSPAGQYPSSVTVGDLNGDGKPDLVTANSGNVISVLLGNGNGTFQSPETLAVGQTPYSIVIADVNGDGKPDIFVANKGSDSVSILLGNGNGTFQAQQTFAIGYEPTSLAIGDLSGNGKLDIVTANDGQNLTLFLGNGNGTFQSGQVISAGGAPMSVAVADLNGEADILTANRTDDSVSVLLGNGNGTFQTPRTYAAGNSPDDIAIADLNNDHKPDLIVGSGESTVDATVNVLLGNGNGTFQSPTTITITDIDSCSVAVGDFNNDGNMDIALRTLSNIYILLGNGNGTFQSRLTTAFINMTSLAVADLNGDGSADIVATNNGTNSHVAVLLSDPFANSIRFSAPEPLTGATSLAVADLTGDGDEDVVGFSYYNGLVSVHLGNGNGTFEVPLTFHSGVRSIQLANLNNDGKPDLIGLEPYSNNIDVYLGNGNGTFQGPLRSPCPTVGSPFIDNFTLGDLNNDGNLDAVVAEYAPSGIADILLGNGNGTFQPPETVAVSGYPSSLTLADVNGDGKGDLIVTHPGEPGNVSVLLGNGNGTFGSPQSYAVGIEPQSVTVADLRGDGTLDIIVADPKSGDVSVLLGNGNGTFQAPQSYAIPRYPYASPYFVAVADFNGDGKLDLVAGGPTPTFSLLVGNGNGTFQPQQTFTATYAKQVQVADFNGDGVPDVVIAGGMGDPYDACAVILNQSIVPGSPLTPSKVVFDQSPTPTTVGSVISPPVTVDVEDSNNDIVTTDNSDVTLSIDTTTASGAFLAGTLTEQAINGVATFSTLALNQPGTYTLQASDAALTTAQSASFVISAPTLTQSKIVFDQPPTPTTVGKVISPPITVEVEDSNNAVVTTDSSDVTLSIETTTTAGASLGGTLTEQAVNGVATFSTLTLSLPGTFTLRAADGSLTPAQSNSFIISSPLPATKLAIDHPPTGAFVGNIITPPVTILVEDTDSETVTTDNSTVTVSIATGPADAVLGGTLSVQAIDGKATFNNLSLDTPGPYTLTFTDGLVASVTSSRFSISALPATKLAIGHPPTGASVGSVISPAITILAENTNSGTVLSADSTVTVSIASGPAGAALGGTLSVQAVNGVATFSDLTLDTAGPYTLKFTDGSLTSVTSGSFNVTATVGSNPFAVLSNGILTITGTANADTISVADSAGSVVATLNGTASSPFTASEITGGISITGGAGNDTISVAGIPIASTIGGAGGDDLLTGGGGNDSLRGGAGNDTIGGAGGDDTIVGGGDDDSLKGGAGNDFLAGGPGNDTLHGCVGNDSLIGGAGDDQINGNAGDDTIVGTGSSQLFAGPGNDQITGNTTSDESDSIYCGSATDTILAGSDDQIFDSVQGDSITGGMIVG